MRDLEKTVEVDGCEDTRRYPKDQFLLGHGLLLGLGDGVGACALAGTLVPHKKKYGTNEFRKQLG